MKVMNKARLENPLLLILVLSSLIILLSSCASGASVESTTAGDSESAPTQVSESKSVAKAEAKATSVSEATAAQAEKSPAMEEAVSMAELGESCKQQPYVNYEKQAREHIQRGWAATQAQRFGIGFRDSAEYEKWRDTHSQLFTKVSEICEKVSECVKQNPSDKENKCASQMKRFEQWQVSAKRFAEEVKVVERSQPPMLCSLVPSVDDPSQCYTLVADQIDKTCQTPACADAAGCFRGVYFLNDAINQAKLACGFVGQKLSTCRGYIEATARRKAEVEQCVDMYNQLPVEILPVISKS